MKTADNPASGKTIAKMAPREQLHGPAATIPHAPGDFWIEERTRIAVGRGASISGRLIFHEPIRIEGFFRGEVIASDLVVVGQQGRVQGKVRAPRMLVLGELRGDVTECEHLVLGSRARVYGRVEVTRLTVCEGAYIDGDVRMPKASLDRSKRSDSA